MANQNKVQALPTNIQETTADSGNVEGIIAGLIGAAILAVWFLIIDTLHGRPLYTPSVLGSVLFRSNHAPSELKDLAVSIEMTITYTWIHVLVFGVLGGLASRLLWYAESHSNLGFAILLLFVILAFGFVGVAFLLAEPVLGLLTWPAVLLGNLLAAAGMASYLSYRHRTITILP